MSLSVYSKDAIFTNTVSSLAAPNKEGLVGEWFFGVDLESSVINRAGGLPLTKLGNAATYFDGYVKLAPTGGSYGFNSFITPITPKYDGGLTIIAVARNTSGTGFANIYNCQFSGKNLGVFETAAPSLAYYNGTSVLTETAQTAIPDIAAKWSVIATTGGRDEFGKINLWQDGIKTSGTAPNKGFRSVGTTETFKLVNDVSTDYNLAYVAIYERTLTDIELDNVYAGLKGILKLRGVVL